MSALCPGDDGWFRTISPFVTVLWYQKIQPHWLPEPGDQGAAHWVATKTEAPDVKPRVLDKWKDSLLGGANDLESSRGRAQM